MPADGSRLLYLARHAEPTADGRALTGRGTQQAEHLGRRLAALEPRRVLHGPLPRAAETAHAVAAQCPQAPRLDVVACAGDYVPYLPAPGEVDDAWAGSVHAFLADVSDEDATHGAGLAAEALKRLTGPAGADRDEVDVVITHAFTIGWLLRDALGAPAWRWVGLNQCHAALTVIRYSSERPPSVVVANDTTHLPDDLRWTGFPDELRA